MIIEIPDTEVGTLRRLAELLTYIEDGDHKLGVGDSVLHGPNCHDGAPGGCCAINIDISGLGEVITKSLEAGA